MTNTRRWRALALATLLAALGLVGTPADAEAAPSLVQACSTAPTGGTVVRTAGGRQYRLRVPAGLTGSAPLVLVLHGWNATPTQTETESGMNTFADTYGAIVAYPTGSDIGGSGWNYWDASGADSTYLRNVVTAISGEFCVNAARVHAVGFSMGGIMAQRLACNAKDVFASVAGHATNDISVAWSGKPNPAPCPSQPASVALSCSASWFDPMTGPCNNATRAAWRTRLACSDTPTVSDTWGERASYPCGTRVLYWRNWHAIHVPGHQWPSGSAGTQFRAEMAFYFAVTPKP